MGLRQTINDKSLATATVATLIVLSVAAVVLVRTCGSGDAVGERAPTKAFFTTDDGRTYFVDDARRVPPYTVDRPGDAANHGKPAVRARVVRCGGGEPFVSAVEKFADADKRRIESIMAQQGDRAAALPTQYKGGGAALVKRPGTGDQGWVKFGAGRDEEYKAIVKPRCPDGGVPEPVVAE